MDTSESNKKKHGNVDQFDDLTRFLDEDFDTNDVDLFEFTTEKDSPLTELKSIVLSLEWEITDSILQDLADEIERLKDEEIFQSDKVSGVYLQGLDKIGQYIRSEGANAHPNSIKLLLTFYYDFEKILSSETITGPEITALLKGDVRKFKILQYQIAKKHGVETHVPVAEEAKQMGLIFTDSEALRKIRVILLELDWEVTDEGLQRLTEQLDKLKSKFTEDRFVQILIQGLYSLKSYVSEEKGRAHPEAYTLLHSFSEGIAKLIENGDLDEEKRLEIIIEQINGLNNLKALIAGSVPGAEVTGGEAGEKTEAEPIPGGERAPVPAGEKEITPALAGDETEGSEIKEEALPEELEERLEFFFGQEEKASAPSQELTGEKTVEKIEQELEPFEEEHLTGYVDIEPALAADESEGTEIREETPSEELTERLEFFFGTDEEVASFGEKESQAAEKRGEEISGLTGDEEEGFTSEEEIVPALSGSPEEAGFGVEQEVEPPADLAKKLDDFFGEAKESEEERAGEDEEFLLTSALTDETEAALTDRARPMKNEKEYQAAVIQIRTHFKKLESSLRQENEALKKEVENLRAQLKQH